jgi:hypothetical protein
VLTAIGTLFLFAYKIRLQQIATRAGAVVEMVAEAVDGARRSVRGRSCRPSVGVPWVFPMLPFFGRFRGVRAVGGVVGGVWRLMGLYVLIFAPCRVLRCALRVPLPFSRDFSPILARFAVGDR